eukprot:14250442-Alexandrium_andersonii.AAC.1
MRRRLHAKADHAQDEPDPEAEFGLEHEDGAWISEHQSLVIGIRRSVGHLPAWRFGAGLMLDLSRQSVVRAEVLCGRALTMSSRLWHRDHESAIAEGAVAGVGGPPAALRIFAFRSDATNSNVWSGSK